MYNGLFRSILNFIELLDVLLVVREVGRWNERHDSRHLCNLGVCHFRACTFDSHSRGDRVP